MPIGPPEMSRRVSPGLSDIYLDFRYLICDLGEAAYKHYRHSDNLVV